MSESLANLAWYMLGFQKKSNNKLYSFIGNDISNN